MKVSIIGLGWLGLDLAHHLNRLSYSVCGSTTSGNKIKNVKSTDIKEYRLFVSKKSELEYSSESIFQADTIIITLPFKRSFKPSDIYYNQLNLIANEIKKHSPKAQVIFTSSTSIYPKYEPIVDENFPLKNLDERQTTLLNVEKLIQNTFKNSVILRLGGLFGGNRKIGMFMSNKESLDYANSPVNLIHRKDVIRIIELIIRKQLNSGLFNCTCNHHPSKEELYEHHSKLLNVIPPKFISKDIKTKKVLSNNLKTILNYTFICNNLFLSYD